MKVESTARGAAWWNLTARFLFGLLLAILAASQASACGTCPACRIAQACDGTAPVGGYEVGQALTSISGVGSAADPIQPGSWTLAVLPDTQVYAQTYPQHFSAQTQWIADNAVSHNIKMVLHEGDIVNTPTSNPQWVNARAALDNLNGVVPYALAPGNHDYGTSGTANNRTSLFHNPENFGPTTPYANQSSIGGFFEAGKTDNSWHTFSAGGNDWIVLALEFGPRDEVVAWANDVMEANPDKLAILVTHAYMYYDETIYDWATKGSSQSWNPHSYGIADLPGGVNDGQELWDNLVKLHENFRFVFNGHVLGDGTGYRATVGDNGNVVHQMLANYQFNTQGGQGDMRLLEFLEDGETVNVRTYSPVLDRYDTDPDQQFTLNLNELPPPPPVLYHAVAANLVAVGPTDPADNIVTAVPIPQTGDPPVGTGQINRGDYQITVNGRNVTYQQGILLASITQHDRPDFVNRRATVEAGRNPFGDGYLSLSIMEAGTHPSNPGDNEVNFNTSVAWFAFEGGWKGAHVNGNGTLAAGAFNGVEQAQVTRTNVGRYTVNLGPNAQNDGLLFVIGNNNDNIVVQTGLLPGGTAWDVRVEDNATNFGATGEDKDWSFLYLPYSTQNLVAGLYDGIADANVSSVGDFTMTRTATGQYQLAIAGQSPETGMLITTVAHETSLSGTTAPDDNILNYQPGPNGTFLINSYDLPTLNLQNTKFAWAFVGFDDPLSLEALPPEVELEITVERSTGIVTLTNGGLGDVGIQEVTILSNNGALLPANWNSIAQNYDEAPGDGSVDPDDPWTVLSSTVFNLNEEVTSGGDGGTLTAGQMVDLGGIWKKSRLEDLVVQVMLADGSTLNVNINYTGGPGGLSFHRSDLNTDGVVDATDWDFFYPNMLADLSSMTGVEKVLAGDLNGDGKVDVNDFVLFKTDFEALNGAGSFDAMLAGVPEPSTMALALIAVTVAGRTLRHRRRLRP